MTNRQFSREWFLSEAAVLLYMALLTVAIHIPFFQNYGYFRDELYYIACSNHLDWGYVDQPPLSLLILRIMRFLFGDSLVALRILPALAGGTIVFITGLMAKQLGGGRFAQVLAALSALASPIFLGNAGRYFSMNAFDLVFWAIGGYIVLLIVRNNSQKLWLLFGLVAGLGVLNKYSMGILVLGVIAALFLTPHRKQLLSKWFWIGGLLGALIVVPHSIWEFRNAFPSVEFMHNVTTLKNRPITPWAFFLVQFRDVGIIWFFGLVFYFFHKPAKPFRIFGILYLIVFALMALQNPKPYYLSPIYPLFFASSGCMIESLARRSVLGWLKPVAYAVVLVGGVVAMPLALPVLPVDTYLQYQHFLGLVPEREERGAAGILPQHFADMFGWPEMVDTVARVYGGLSPTDQAKCMVYVRNYGEAAAIDFFGPGRGLPRASCTHNSYWFWRPETWSGDVCIIFGRSNDTTDCFNDLRQFFGSVELAGFTRCNYAMPYEDGRPIFVCRGSRITLEQLWERDKHFI
jgi:hypothetical protein